MGFDPWCCTEVTVPKNTSTKKVLQDLSTLTFLRGQRSKGEKTRVPIIVTLYQAPLTHQNKIASAKGRKKKGGLAVVAVVVEVVVGFGGVTIQPTNRLDN